MPLLSIIVPVYGAEKYIAAMIDSVIAQTFTNWEAILVDDGSKDASGEICEEYARKDSRIRVIHKENGGVSSARNEGIKTALGDFITFVDADDQLNPSFLSNFSFDMNLDFEIQGFYVNHPDSPESNLIVQPKETRIATMRDVYAEAELIKISRGPYCKLFKTQIIKDNKIFFPINISFGEDAIFVKLYLLNCSGKARSIVAADYIYNDFNDPNSLTHRVHPAQAMYDVAKDDLELYERLVDRFGKMPGEVDADFRRIRTLEFYQSIVVCMHEKHKTFLQKCGFLEMAKLGMYQQIKNEGSLPLTYRIIKFCIDFLPIKVSTFVFVLLLK